MFMSPFGSEMGARGARLGHDFCLTQKSPKRQQNDLRPCPHVGGDMDGFYHSFSACTELDYLPSEAGSLGEGVSAYICRLRVNRENMEENIPLRAGYPTFQTGGRLRQRGDIPLGGMEI